VNNLDFTSLYRDTLLRVLSDIVAAVGRGDFAALVLLDLSAAFGTANHDILLQRLHTSLHLDTAKATDIPACKYRKNLFKCKIDVSSCILLVLDPLIER